MRWKPRPRFWHLLLLLVMIPVPAFPIPAFARKYQLRCTACHEAWPVLNDFGRAFRDNGYQLSLGKDSPTATPIGYWPVAFRLTPAWERDTVNNQPTDQGVQTLRTSSGFSANAFDMLSAGTLAPNVSFLFVPTFDDGELSVESAWVRFSNIANSTWLNLKLGHHEMDLPRSAHRPWDLTSSGYLIYSYHPLGSASAFDMGANQDGIEWVGHDRGSMNRVAVSLISANDSPGSKGFFNTPGIYVHATHEFLLKSDAVSEAKIGAFAADASWPTTFLSSGGEDIGGTGTDLKHSRRYGVEGQIFFGPNVTPVHAILVLAHGADDQGLIDGATRNGSWNGGFLEVGWTPTLKTTPFARYDWIKNSTQPSPDLPKNANDMTQYVIGVRHTFNYSPRAEYALHVEYSSLRTRGAGPDEPTVTTTATFIGIDFAF